MHHYIYKLEDKLGAFYFGVRSSFVPPDKDSYMGSGVWPKQCRRSGVTLKKSIISIHSSRQEACVAESCCINEHLDNEMLMNRYFGVQNHLLGPRETTKQGGVVWIDVNFLNSAFWVTESASTRLVWITLLCLANSSGEVHSTIPAIAKAACVPVADCITAIERMKTIEPLESVAMRPYIHIEATDYGWKFVHGHPATKVTKPT